MSSSRKQFADRNVKDSKGEYLPIKDRAGASQVPFFQNTRQLQEEQEKIVQEVKKKIQEAEHYDTDDDINDKISDQSEEQDHHKVRGENFFLEGDEDSSPFDNRNII